MDYKITGREVIESEIRALQLLSEKIGESFENAAECIKNARGKVIITGIGKSGHVGRKIAATMASLGIPSFFLHSTEALHGDTGMIQAQDVIFAISNSGTTAEVVETAGRARTLGAKVIAMTGGADSPLAKNADIVLDISVEKEADQFNLAPTNSTTVTMALGDALAVAVSREIGFSVEDYAFRHAGGALGSKARKASDS